MGGPVQQPSPQVPVSTGQTFRDLIAQSRTRPGGTFRDLVAQSRPPEPPGALETAGAVAANALRQPLESAASAIFEAPAIVGYAIATPILKAFGATDEDLADLYATNSAHKAALGLKAGIESMLPRNPAVEAEHPLAMGVSGAIGEGLGLAGAAAVSGGVAVPALLMANAAGAGAFTDAKQKGADDETAFIAGALNWGVAEATAPIFGRLFSRINARSGGKLAQELTNIALETGTGAGTGVALQAASNVIAEHTYDAEREWYDHLLEGGTLGAAGVFPFAAGARWWKARGAANPREAEAKAALQARLETAQETLAQPNFVEEMRAKVSGETDPYARADMLKADLGREPTPYELRTMAGLSEAEARNMSRVRSGKMTVEDEARIQAESAAAEDAARVEANRRRDQAARERWSERERSQMEAEIAQDSERRAAERARMEESRRRWAEREAADVEVQRSKLAEAGKLEAERTQAEDARRASEQAWYDEKVKPWVGVGPEAAAAARGEDIGPPNTMLGMPRAPLPERPVAVRNRSAAELADPVGGDPRLYDEAKKLRPPPPPEEGGASLVDIGDGFHGTLDRTLPAEYTATKVGIFDQASKVLRAAGLRIPIQWGGIINGHEVKGYYDFHADTLRVGKSYDYVTMLHEIGHALEDAVFGRMHTARNAENWKGLPPEGMKELDHLGKLLYGDKVPNGGYAREGLAEFTRMWAMSPEALRTVAPNAWRWFEAEFLMRNRALGSELDKLQKLITAWRFQGSAAREAGSKVDPLKAQGFIEKFKRTMRNTVTRSALLDEAAMLKVLEQPLTRAGKTVAPGKSAYQVASAFARNAPAIADRFIHNGVTDIYGNKVGPSLQEAVAPARGRSELLASYARARRSRAVWTDERHPTDPGMSLVDAEKIIGDTERAHPEVVKAYAGLREWWTGVENYMAQASPTYAQAIEFLRKNSPGDYLPLERYFEDMDLGVKGKKGGSARTGKVGEKRVGSSRPVKDPLPTLVAEASRRIGLAHKRAVLDAVIDLADLPGNGFLLSEINPRGVSPEVSKLAQELEARTDVSGSQRSSVLELFDELSASDIKGGEMPKLRVWDPKVQAADGKFGGWREFNVHPELYKAFDALDLARIPQTSAAIKGWLASAGVTSRNAIVLGTTGLRPAFGLFTNVMYDLPSLFLYSRSSASTPRILATVFERGAKSFVRAISGGKYSDPWMDWFYNVGLDSSQAFKSEYVTRASAHGVRRLVDGIGVTDITPGKVLRETGHYAMEVLQFMEPAIRQTELKLVARDLGWKPGEPMNMDVAVRLMNATKDVTINRTRAGQLVKAYNLFVPFLSAAVAGPREMVSAAKDHPARFFARGIGMVTIPSVALWYYHLKDNPWWKERRPKEKLGSWYIPFEGADGPEWFKLPMSNEMALTFGGIPIAMLDALHDRDPDLAGQYALALMGRAAPPVLPPVVEEAGEQLANKDLYTGAPIVPGSEQGLSPEEQYNEFTTRAAIRGGDIAGVSPRRIDHAMRGLFGPAATDFVNILGTGAVGIPRDQELSDIPVFGQRMFERGGQANMSSQSIDQFYDLLGFSHQREASQKMPETEDERSRRLVLEDAHKAIVGLRAMASNEPDTKKRRALQTEAVDIAREVVEHVKSGKTERLWDVYSRAKEYGAEKKLLDEQRRERLRTVNP